MEHLNILFAILAFFTIKYIVFGELAYLIFYLNPKHLKFKIVNKSPTPSEIKKERKWALIALSYDLLYSVLFYFFLYVPGFTKISLEIGETKPLLLNALLMFVLWEIYLYLYHRWMHENTWLYKKIHIVHHYFKNPTPISAFSFHPIESLFEFSFYIFFALIFPHSIYSFIIFKIALCYVDMVGHCGFEFYPKFLLNSKLRKLIINSATDHTEHHSKFRNHYSSVFSFLDHLFNLKDKKKPKK